MVQNNFIRVFDEKLPIIGMIHLSKPSYKRSDVTKRALAEIDTLERLGYSGALVENYHSDDTFIEPVLKELAPRKIKIGINVLEKNLGHEESMRRAFELSSRYDLRFIQFDYISGEYHGGFRFNEDIYRNLRKLNPDIAIIGGVHPKYYTPLTDLDSDIIKGMSLTDAIAVTGAGTGKETPIEKILDFKNVTRGFPLIVAAGLTPANAYAQLKYADGAIVGSSIKFLSDTSMPIDDELASEFMNVVAKLRSEKYRKN